jgi:hypothetical protein
MSHFLSRVVFTIGFIAAIAAVQRLFFNRPGTELRVETAISTLTPAAWNFVAMEYCYGMLNRTFLVFVTANTLCGARVRGPMSAPMMVSERWYNPHFYPRFRLVEKYAHMNIESPSFLKVSSANFQIPRQQLESCEFTAKPKWGMGTLPYSGRLLLHLRNGTTRELILLGEQNGPELLTKLA